MTETIEALAREAYGWFHQITRPGETTKIDTLRDGAPQWITDVIFEAHDSGNILPDDWTYAAVRAAFEHLTESGDDDDAAHDFADAQVDVYNSDRLAWLQNYPSAVQYVDEGREEFGGGRDLIEEIGTGQYLALTAIFEAVRRGLMERAEEGDDE